MCYKKALELFNTVKDRYGFVIVRNEEYYLAASPSGVSRECGAFIGLIDNTFKVVNSIDLYADHLYCYSWIDFDNLEEACKHLNAIMKKYHKLLFRIKQSKIQQKIKKLQQDFE